MVTDRPPGQLRIGLDLEVEHADGDEIGSALEGIGKCLGRRS